MFHRFFSFPFRVLEMAADQSVSELLPLVSACAHIHSLFFLSLFLSSCVLDCRRGDRCVGSELHQLHSITIRKPALNTFLSLLPSVQKGPLPQLYFTPVSISAPSLSLIFMLPWITQRMFPLSVQFMSVPLESPLPDFPPGLFSCSIQLLSQALASCFLPQRSHQI